jgi:hypothetical protein
MNKFVQFAYAALCVVGASAQAVAAITASVAPKNGPPSTSVTASGHGFDASTLIDVYFDTTEVQLATSDSTGAVTAAFPIPTDAQPGIHWVTLSERRNYSAAQASFNVYVNWLQSGFGQRKRSYNPYENTINYNNVAQLAPLWSAGLDGFANSKPPIVYVNNVYVRDTSQVVRAFSPAGKLLWKATTPYSSFPDALTPAAADGKVIFSDFNGNVIAYPYLCHTNGATCTPSWTKNIGSAVGGGLTLRGDTLYAPAADGNVHLLNPKTGTPGTSILVSSTDALTTWIAFAANGGGFVGHGTHMAETLNNVGSSSDVNYSGTLSFPAVGAHTAYVTETDNFLREVQFGWADAVGGSGCYLQTPPVVVGGTVYAAGCNSVGAYDAATGSAFWTTSTLGPSAGLAYANGILYGCVNSRLIAYAASYGGNLWSGGYCSTAPVIANGILYATYADLTAYTVNGSQASVKPQRPDPRKLRPQLGLQLH